MSLEQFHKALSSRSPTLLAALLVVAVCHSSYSEEIVKEHTLLRNGVRLSLEQHLNADGNLRAESILLVHGLTYSSHEFNVQCEDYSLTGFLVMNGYVVWLLDIAGYGRSGDVEDGWAVDSEYAGDDISAAIRYIVRHGNDERLDILGWSWGTVTAVLAAKKQPRAVSSLILYAPLIFGSEGDAPMERWQCPSGKRA